MGNGILSLLRIVAVLGMGLAAIDIVASVANWVAPVGDRWLGKRAKDFTRDESDQSLIRHGYYWVETPRGTIPELARIEFRSLCNNVWPPARWFCLTALLYAAAARPQSPADPVEARPEEHV